MNTPLAHTSPVAPVIIHTSSTSSAPDWALLITITLIAIVGFIWIYWLHLRVKSLESQMQDTTNALQVYKENYDTEIRNIKAVLNTQPPGSGSHYRGSGREPYHWGN